MELGGPYREEKGQWHRLRLREGATVKDALLKLGIEEELYILVFRDSRKVELTERLAEGDVLVAFPPVGGGGP
ncbi:MAG TPA: MoaD/ThiS family protein [Conexivisphaerales archaeon]|nr:MoaD/ThiS family protein [Conexivisphaerales archaeon]